MKVSVGLCTYNGATHLRKQLDSILAQTRKVNEIVVYDDGSSDNTWQILETYRLKYPGLFQIRQNPINLGSIKNFEQVLYACHGDLIFLSDHDDIWVPEKVEEYITCFEKSPDTNVICSNGYIINENDHVIDALTVWDVPEILENRGEMVHYFDSICYGGNIATGASMAIRKNYIRRILPIPLLGVHHDEWIALIASFDKCFKSINKKLFYYRIHPQQQVGIIPYPNTMASRDELYRNFSSIDVPNFKTIKRKMKKISQKHNFFSKGGDHQLMQAVLSALRHKHYQLKKMLIANYPFKGRLTIVMDKITTKRQLVK